jgi:pimeloyl-ACP methyl ester carboxylesterase
MPAVALGHSLGGVLARALAVKYPARVRQVITLGSPTKISWASVRPRYRPAIRGFQALWHALNNRPSQCGTDQCMCQFGEAVNSRFPRGVTLSSIYTRSDEVVDWRACIAPDGDNHEVSGGHASLAVNPEVYRLLSVILAARVDARGPSRSAATAIATAGVQ